MKCTQVVGMAGFLLEFDAESSMVCPRENAVPERANAGSIGDKHSGRS